MPRLTNKEIQEQEAQSDQLLAGLMSTETKPPQRISVAALQKSGQLKEFEHVGGGVLRYKGARKVARFRISTAGGDYTVLDMKRNGVVVSKVDSLEKLDAVLKSVGETMASDNIEIVTAAPKKKDEPSLAELWSVMEEDERTMLLQEAVDFDDPDKAMDYAELSWRGLPRELKKNIQYDPKEGELTVGVSPESVTGGFKVGDRVQAPEMHAMHEGDPDFWGPMPVGDIVGKSKGGSWEIKWDTGDSSLLSDRSLKKATQKASKESIKYHKSKQKEVDDSDLFPDTKAPAKQKPAPKQKGQPQWEKGPRGGERRKTPSGGWEYKKGSLEAQHRFIPGERVQVDPYDVEGEIVEEFEDGSVRVKQDTGDIIVVGPDRINILAAKKTAENDEDQPPDQPLGENGLPIEPDDPELHSTPPGPTRSQEFSEGLDKFRQHKIPGTEEEGQ